MIRKFLLLASSLFCASVVYAQTFKPYLNDNVDRYAGHFHCYEAPESYMVDLSSPEGYKPFYISHYGRHGCRRHTSMSLYTGRLSLLNRADERGCLTDKGKQVLEQMRVIAADADGRCGDLTPRGELEHRGIAERMFMKYPEVFVSKPDTPAIIESRSTTVPRCIMSMAAFNERLKELNPTLCMKREASKRYLKYLAHNDGYKSTEAVARRICDSIRVEWLSPDRVLRSLFNDQGFIDEIKNPHNEMYNLYLIACILQDVDYLGISMFDLFTEEELYSLWKCENLYFYVTMGPSERHGDVIVDDAKPLLQNIIDSADDVIAGKRNVRADLRFGHDMHLVPLLSLVGVKGVDERVSIEDAENVWNVSAITGMASNIQFIFYRNRKDDIKVRILHNERDVSLSLEGGPFYEWKNLRPYLLSKL